jgi:hypothetical protein
LLSSAIRADRVFRSAVALLAAISSWAREFSALIDWGDPTDPIPVRIRARGHGRRVVIGTHLYISAGIYQVMITIRESAGRGISAKSLLRVIM